MAHRRIRCVVFDYGFTLSSGLYFNVPPPGILGWRDLLQEMVFDVPELTDSWMRGETKIDTIADRLSPRLLGRHDVLHYLRLGCINLGFNEEVHHFARWVKSPSHLVSALVTANMDVFSDVIVP